MTAIERWKTISLAPMYEVSNLGRVRSSLGVRRGKARRILAGYTPPNRYPYVHLRPVPGKRIAVTVHSLVATAFIGPCPDGLEINHKDANRGNPQVDNLGYITHQENCLYGFRVGSNISKKGEDASAAKLTVKQVVAIRRMARTTQYRIIAEKFGITTSGVSRISHGQIWKTAPGPIMKIGSKRGSNQYLHRISTAVEIGTKCG